MQRGVWEREAPGILSPKASSVIRGGGALLPVDVFARTAFSAGELMCVRAAKTECGYVCLQRCRRSATALRIMQPTVLITL